MTVIDIITEISGSSRQTEYFYYLYFPSHPFIILQQLQPIWTVV